MYVELQGKELKKDWKDLIKKAKEEDPNNKNIEKEERLLIKDENQDVISLEFNEADEEIFYAVVNDYGYFSFNIPLDDDLMFKIVDCLKSKADKIKRLLDLNK